MLVGIACKMVRLVEMTKIPHYFFLQNPLNFPILYEFQSFDFTISVQSTVKCKCTVDPV
jgi:hypothetical protein